MNIETTEFIAWMERIMERFDILKEQVSSSQSKYIEIDGEVLLDNQGGNRLCRSLLTG